MSFILDSLKKLEQEKTEQIHEVDLKTVLLKTEDSEKEVMRLKTKMRALLVLSAGILAGAVAMAFVFLKGPGPEVIASAPPPPPPIVKKELPEDMPALETPPATAAMGEKELPPPPPPPEAVEFTPIPEFVIQEQEGDGSMETAVLERDPNSQVRDRPLSSPLPPIAPIPESAKARFPQFDIKGIIFFGEGNPDNYIILRDKGGERTKLREGEVFMQAALMEILPEKARFLFEENLFEKEMGEE